MNLSDVKIETIFIKWRESIGELSRLGITPFDAFKAGYKAAQTPPNQQIQADAKPCERCKVNATDINNNFCRDCGRQLRR